MQKFVIGDIHGGLKALKEVLAKTPIQKEDLLIFLGDYVDGWSESAETIDFLMDLSKEQKCIFIRGNHDELVLDYLKNGINLKSWRDHGGEATIANYAAQSEETIAKHIAFLEETILYHVDDENRLFIHGGFANHRGPQHEYYPHLMSWDRSLWETACAIDPKLKPEDIRYPNRLRMFKEIYIGHTPVTRIGRDTPTNFANVWNIDTGAAFKGSLSILNIDTKEYWQSTAVHELYPEEKGRN